MAPTKLTAVPAAKAVLDKAKEARPDRLELKFGIKASGGGELARRKGCRPVLPLPARSHVRKGSAQSWRPSLPCRPSVGTFASGRLQGLADDGGVEGCRRL